ncbi:MAG TPA: hypothetical protein VFZ32_09925 [Micromonosporaceae bacterium]
MLAATALVAVGMTAGLMVWQNVDSSPGTSCIPVNAPRGGTSAPAAAAPGGGGIRVIEKGFTQVVHKGMTVSLGAVLENTSAMAGYRVQLSFRVLGSSGQTVVPNRSGELLRQEIPVILPGQRIGTGAWTYVQDDAAGRPVTVSRFEVALGQARFIPQGNRHFAEVTTRGNQLERSDVEPASGSVRFSIRSGYCGATSPRGIAMLFRDSHGALVGGSFDLENSEPRCQPGVHTELVTAFRSVPDDIDQSRTTTYPYCDPAPVDVGVKSSDEPVN